MEYPRELQVSIAPHLENVPPHPLNEGVTDLQLALQGKRTRDISADKLI